MPGLLFAELKYRNPSPGGQELKFRQKVAKDFDSRSPAISGLLRYEG